MCVSSYPSGAIYWGVIKLCFVFWLFDIRRLHSTVSELATTERFLWHCAFCSKDSWAFSKSEDNWKTRGQESAFPQSMQSECFEGYQTLPKCCQTARAWEVPMSLAVPKMFWTTKRQSILVTDRLDVTSVEQNKGLLAVSHSNAATFISFKIDV